MNDYGHRPPRGGGGNNRGGRYDSNNRHRDRDDRNRGSNQRNFQNDRPQNSYRSPNDHDPSFHENYNYNNPNPFQTQETPEYNDSYQQRSTGRQKSEYSNTRDANNTPFPHSSEQQYRSKDPRSPNSDSASYNKTQNRNPFNYPHQQPIRNIEKEKFHAVTTNLQNQLFSHQLQLHTPKPLLPDPPSSGLLPDPPDLLSSQNNYQRHSRFQQQQQPLARRYSDDRVPIKSVYETFNSNEGQHEPIKGPNQGQRSVLVDSQRRGQEQEVRKNSDQRSPRKSEAMAFLANMSADELLKNFRSLECAGCQRHFGYQSRTRKDMVFCTANCMDDHSGCVLPTPPESQSQPRPTPAQAPVQAPPKAPLGPSQQPNYPQSQQQNYPQSQQQNFPQSQQQNFSRDDREARIQLPRTSGKPNETTIYQSPPIGGYGSSAGGNGGSPSSGFMKPTSIGSGGSPSSSFMKPTSVMNRERIVTGTGPGSRPNYGNGSHRGSSSAASYGRKAGSGFSPFNKYGDDENEWGGADQNGQGGDVVDQKMKVPQPTLPVATSAPARTTLPPPQPVVQPKPIPAEIPPKPAEVVPKPAEIPPKPVEIAAPRPAENIPKPEERVPVSTPSPRELSDDGSGSSRTQTQKLPPRKPPPLGASIASLTPEPTKKKVEVAPDALLLRLSNQLKWQKLELNRPLSVSRPVINDIGDFFCHTYENHKLSVAMLDKVAAVLASGTVQKLARAAPATACLAPFEGDFYRGEIITLHTTKPDKAIVFFCDYGNVETVPVDQLMEFPKELADTPRLAIHCRWDLVLSDEYGAEKRNAIWAQDKLHIKPTHVVTDGQYIIQNGDYVSEAEFEIVPHGR